jgi:hypothetical protein
MWLTFGHTLANSSERFALRFRGLIDVCGVDIARNRLCEDALAKECDWLLMVDSDTWVEDGTSLLQMISTADRQKADVVVAPGPVRGRDQTDQHLMVYNHELSDDGFARLPVPPDQLDGKVIRVDAAATAVMAIRLVFVARLPRPWFRFEYIEETHRLLGEDLRFCNQVRLHGGLILADGRVKTRHLGRPQTLTSPVGTEEP